MVEPTESESKTEIDRLADALLAIRNEIREVVEGKADKTDNVLKNAPHTYKELCADAWPHVYGREKAAFPVAGLREQKFWTVVSRINNTLGDRNVVCVCPPMEAYV
jgi:glycine dehydrogenase